MEAFTNLLLEFLERSVGMAYNLQASASSLKLPELTSDAVVCGITQYGAPFPEVEFRSLADCQNAQASRFEHGKALNFVRIDPAGTEGTTRQPGGNDSTTHENQGTQTSVSLPSDQANGGALSRRLLPNAT